MNDQFIELENPTALIWTNEKINTWAHHSKTAEYERQKQTNKKP